MTNYVLDYSKWRCGEHGSPSVRLGKGPTRMLNFEGFMCCLGQIALQMGVEAHNLCLWAEPGGVQAGLDQTLPYDPLFVTENGTNTEVAEELMTINDSDTTTIKTKIRRIRGILEKAGHSLEVVNGPSDISPSGSNIL